MFNFIEFLFDEENNLLHNGILGSSTDSNIFNTLSFLPTGFADEKLDF